MSCTKDPKENIKKVEVLEYPELGMEAVWTIEVEDFPAFILVDDKGNDFFKQILHWDGLTPQLDACSRAVRLQVIELRRVFAHYLSL